MQHDAHQGAVVGAGPGLGRAARRGAVPARLPALTRRAGLPRLTGLTLLARLRTGLPRVAALGALPVCRLLAPAWTVTLALGPGRHRAGPVLTRPLLAGALLAGAMLAGALLLATPIGSAAARGGRPGTRRRPRLPRARTLLGTRCTRTRAPPWLVRRLSGLLVGTRLVCLFVAHAGPSGDAIGVTTSARL
ncbi:hypothetical protein GCM10009583_31690 [Ornithinicoccus hortensis]